MNRLTPFLWVAQSRLYATNSGVFIGDGQAVLIDPGIYPDEINALARFVAEQETVPSALVITHHHWDHILGPEQFPGIKVIAQANYVAEVEAHSPRLVKQIADWEKAHDVKREEPFVIPLPDQTFTETLTLPLGDLNLRLIHAPGHAPDQLAVYRPEGAVLWAADMLSDLEIPLVSHNLAAYEKTLAKLADLEIQSLVPGHGQPTQDPSQVHARFSQDRAYLTELRQRVELAIGQGKTVQETLDSCADMGYRHREQNQGYHRLNVESAYLELGGQADPARFGWDQTFEVTD